MPRARRSGGYMSAAAARERRIVPCETPTSAKPATTIAADSTSQPSAVVRQPAIPATQPPASTGIRPSRSISRPAGSAASAPAVRKIAGPSPRMPSTPVTRTSVTVPTATASCTIPDRHVRVAASRIVFRRIGKLSTRRIYPSRVIRRRVTVRGHVQGVFFRETTRRRAQARGVAGWVAQHAGRERRGGPRRRARRGRAIVALHPRGPARRARRLGRRRAARSRRDCPGSRPGELSARGRRPCRPGRPAGRRAC